MTPHQTLAVAIRLFAIGLALYGIALLAAMAATVTSQMVLGTGVVLVLVVLGLWFFPKTVARRLLAPEPEAPQTRTLTRTDPWFRVGCALIGLWLFTNALPKVATVMAVLSDPSSVNESVLPWVLPMFVQIAAAAWLFFGTRGLVQLYRWAQDAGRPAGNQ